LFFKDKLGRILRQKFTLPMARTRTVAGTTTVRPWCDRLWDMETYCQERKAESLSHCLTYF
jgi:hypothetical protein